MALSDVRRLLAPRPYLTSIVTSVPGRLADAAEAINPRLALEKLVLAELLGPQASNRDAVRALRSRIGSDLLDAFERRRPLLSVIARNAVMEH